MTSIPEPDNEVTDKRPQSYDFDPYDALYCRHQGGAITVAVSSHTGSWSARCGNCGDTWRRTTRNVPLIVMRAVFEHVGLVGIDHEQAEALGLSVLRVGERYVPPSSLQKGLRWIIAPSRVECSVFHNELTPELINAFHDERTEFALITGDHALILAARFGHAIGWWDASWQATCQQEHLPAGIPVPKPGQHLFVTLALVDSVTGLVAGLRAVTWPHRFHAAVHAAVHSQLNNKSSRDEGLQEIEYWTERYPEPIDLVTQRAELTCRGGAATAHVR